MTPVKNLVKIKKKSSFVSNLFYLLIICFALPTGTLFGVPVKLILCGLICICLLFYANSLKIDKITFVFLFILFCLVLWSFIAIANGFSISVINCLKSFLSLLLVIWLAWLLYCNGLIQLNKVSKALIISSYLLIAFKIIFEIYFMVFNLDTVTEQNIFKTIFGTEPMTAHFYVGNIKFHRIWYINDAFPFVYFSYYLVTKNKFWKKLLFCAVMFLFTLITYSRVYMLQYVVCIFFPLILYFLNIGESKYSLTKCKQLLLFLLFIVFLFLLFLIKIDDQNSLTYKIYSTFIERFSGQGTQISDDIREEQSIYLWQEINKNPLIGQGLGAYIYDYIRAADTLYGYELEYVSFIMQFGFIGFALIIGSIYYIIIKLCLKSNGNKLIILVTILNIMMFAIKPFFNPTFLSSASASIIVACFIFNKSLCGSDIKRSEIKG